MLTVSKYTRPSNYMHEHADCTVVALTIATGLSYDACHEFLSIQGRNDGWPVPVPIWPDTVTSLPMFKPLLLDCTIDEFVNDHPAGTFIGHIRGHTFAIKDSTVFDVSENMWSDGDINYRAERLICAWQLIDEVTG